MTSRELDICIQKYCSGDKEIFDEIYYDTYKSVYLSIRTIIKDANTIEDLMQDTYMKALDNLSTYKLGTNFKAWICRIGRNNAINFYNHQKKVDILEDNSAVFDVPSKESKLNYYLSFLDGIEREIVIYHLILEMKFKDISKILDLPLSTCFHMYKKSIEKIKKKV